MRNVLEFYDDLLRKNWALNPLFLFDDNKETEINIYDSDIGSKIIEETVKVIKELKVYYYECNIEDEQRYYFEKLSHHLHSLSGYCESLLDNLIKEFKEYGLRKEKLPEYTNGLMIYTCLGSINNELQFTCRYLMNDDHNSLEKCFKKEYPGTFHETKQEIDKNGNLIEVGTEVSIEGIKPAKEEKLVKIEVDPEELIKEYHLSSDKPTVDNKKIVWGGTPKEFVNLFSEAVEKKWIHAQKNARTERVKLLFDTFLVITEKEEPIELSTLQGYFSKNGRGDTF